MRQADPNGAQSKASVCYSTLAGIAGSNPTVDMGVHCRCFVLPGRCLCDGLMTRPEEFYRACVYVFVWVWSSSLDTDEAWPTGGVVYHKKVRLRESYETRYINLPYETRYIYLLYETRYIYLPYETRYILLPEGHKLLKQYLHEVSSVCQA